ncbi:hypothetical protein L0Z02_29690 (plasmid) [Burkholderia multivorans]|uniref:Uncharacterized protein n=1 Tax=Burkholderia multivorans TaxID=87883 RepID=A0AAP2HQP4_9BURK|nr:hypothetical protein [Burkholderia multivorans]MBU9360770.1 hypothetical protein [Burkholderia multivorans]MCO1459886.1 hypothetical protein [Burkholderia multivorans]UQO21297.1 hypothetical protein L0Z02_29690 [Burkholderia multivorans]HEM7843231.1 hypothetical protein [Burkholderia multivorans]HEM7908552.1 hypothetical protein [Burkholderia multivorans]
MWHKVTFVAESQRVDAEAFERFASTKMDQYGLLDDGTGLEVSTWHVDKLIADFKISVSATSA